MWGIVGSAAFSLLTERYDQVFVMCPIGAAVALASLAIARVGEPSDSRQPRRLHAVCFACVLTVCSRRSQSLSAGWIGRSTTSATPVVKRPRCTRRLACVARSRSPRVSCTSAPRLSPSTARNQQAPPQRSSSSVLPRRTPQARTLSTPSLCNCSVAATALEARATTPGVRSIRRSVCRVAGWA